MNITFIPDALVVLLSLWHPAFVLVALIQYVVRRHRFTARGFWLLLGCPETTELLLVLLPGLDIMSNDQAVLSGAGTGSDDAVLPQQNQVEPAEPAFLELHATVVKLAIMKRPNGAYLFSANQIRDTVGGNAATIKGWIAEVRNTNAEQSIGQQGRWEFDDHGNMQKVR